MAVSSAPLEMAYPPCTGCGWRATIDATMTTEPPPRSRMDGKAARVIWSDPKRLVSMILRQMARSTSSKLWKASKRKALLTSTSMPPKASVALAIRRAHASAIGDVRRHGDGSGTQTLDLGQHLVERRLSPRPQHQVRPVRGQGSGRLATQSRPHARDNADLSAQQAGGRGRGRGRGRAWQNAS